MLPYKLHRRRFGEIGILANLDTYLGRQEEDRTPACSEASEELNSSKNKERFNRVSLMGFEQELGFVVSLTTVVFAVLPPGTISPDEFCIDQSFVRATLHSHSFHPPGIEHQRIEVGSSTLPKSTEYY